MRVSRVAWLVAATYASFIGPSRGDEANDEAAVASAAHGSAAEGMYFYVTNKPAAQKCFVIRQGEGTIFHVHYRFPGAKDQAKISLELAPLLQDTGGKQGKAEKPVESKRILTEEEGTCQFKIKRDGSYSLCAITKSEVEGRGLRLSLDFDTGKRDSLYEEVKKEFDLNDAQIYMIKLKNRAEQMVREADFMQGIETASHELAFRNSRDVIWWPIIQVVILLITGFYQVRHLKQFFQAKRLV